MGLVAAASLVYGPPESSTELRATGSASGLAAERAVESPFGDWSAITTTTLTETAADDTVPGEKGAARSPATPPGEAPDPGATTVPPGVVADAPAVAPPAGPAPQPAASFEVRVRTDRGAYVAKETVRVDVDICNSSNTTAARWVYEGQEVSFSLIDADGEPAQGGANSAGDGRWVEWQPGECRPAKPLLWDQSTNMTDADDGVVFSRVQAGTYRMQADFNGQHTGSDPSAPWREDAASGLSAPFEIKGVTATVTTNKASYALGEPVAVTATICNPNSSAHTETLVWDPDLELRMERDGHVVEQQGSPKGPVDPYPMRFEAHQCRIYRWVWGQDDQEGAQVPSGRYAVESLWFGHSNPDPPSGREATTGMWIDRVPFTIG